MGHTYTKMYSLFIWNLKLTGRLYFYLLNLALLVWMFSESKWQRRLPLSLPPGINSCCHRGDIPERFLLSSLSFASFHYPWVPLSLSCSSLLWQSPWKLPLSNAARPCQEPHRPGYGWPRPRVRLLWWAQCLHWASTWFSVSMSFSFMSHIGVTSHGS